MSDLEGVLADLDKLFVTAQRKVDAARHQQSDPHAGASGQALDGKVVVRMGADGRVRDVTLADEVMRLGPQELSRALTTAFNQAWAACRSDDAAAQVAAAMNPAALSAQMREIHEQGMRSMREITGALMDTMAKIDRRLP